MRLLLVLCCMILQWNSFAGSLLLSADLSIMQELVSTVDALRNAAIPNSIGSAIAISVSEGLAGVAGGLAARGTAKVIGDVKIDSISTKLSSTGAFFGTRGFIRGASVALGIPRSLAVPVASVLATVVSERTKAVGRNATILMKSEAEQLPLQEIAGDVSKWLTYDALEDNIHLALTLPGDIAVSAGFGAVSSFCGALVRDGLTYDMWAPFNFSNSPTEKYPTALPAAAAFSNRKIELPSVSTRKKLAHPSGMMKKYSQLVLEGAILFASYKAITGLEAMVAPESFEIKFAFDAFLEMMEKYALTTATTFYD